MTLLVASLCGCCCKSAKPQTNSEMSIKIVAVNHVKPECVAQFKSLAAELIRESRAESGNVFYTLNQSLSDSTELTFIECWRDEQAIQSHNATEHFTRIVPKLGALCATEGSITLYNEL